MAQPVSTFPTRSNHKYPWDTWLDGQVWELTVGEDITSSVAAFRVSARAAAVARGKTVKTSYNADNRLLYIQARDQ